MPSASTCWAYLTFGGGEIPPLRCGEKDDDADEEEKEENTGMTRRLYHPGLFYSSLLAHLLAVSMALDFGTVGFLDLFPCPLPLPWDLDLSLSMDGCMMDFTPHAYRQWMEGNRQWTNPVPDM